MMRKWFTFCLLLFNVCVVNAEDTDSLKRWGLSAGVNPGRVLSFGKYQKKWQKGKDNLSLYLGANYHPLPADSNGFDADYGYPTVSARLKMSFNHGVTMHRDKDPDWGYAEEVDYNSHMGNSVALFGTFERPLFRNKHFEAEMDISIGLACSNTIYNKENNIDNELIGSHLLIYFGMGAHVTWMFTQKVGLKAGVDYWHVSNGALDRPNKGANVLGPSIALVYVPSYQQRVWGKENRFNPPFEKKLYLDMTVGVGAKTLYEEFEVTQFQTPKGEKDYRTEDFKLYMAYSTQTDLMYRYARRWASGVGLDLFYGTYASRVAEIEEKRGVNAKHHPWSVGLAVKHQAFYRQWSLAMAVGWYLHREMGSNAAFIEEKYYERIGLRYTFPGSLPISIGASVKAHSTIADLTEVNISLPIRFK